MKLLALLLTSFFLLIGMTSAAEAGGAVAAVVSIVAGGGIGGAIARFALGAALSFITNKLFAPDVPNADASEGIDPGVRQRVATDPNNKLPVVYGTARVFGQITYAAISDDNQRMAFILPLSEGPVTGIGNIYWDTYKLRLPSTAAERMAANNDINNRENPILEVEAAYDNFGSNISDADFSGPTTVTTEASGYNAFLNGNLRVRKYPAGGRCTNMERFNSAWNDDNQNRTMPNVAYLYVELDYDSEDGVTGLTQRLGADVTGRSIRTFSATVDLPEGEEDINAPAARGDLRGTVVGVRGNQVTILQDNPITPVDNPIYLPYRGFLNVNPTSSDRRTVSYNTAFKNILQADRGSVIGINGYVTPALSVGDAYDVDLTPGAIVRFQFPHAISQDRFPSSGNFVALSTPQSGNTVEVEDGRAGYNAVSPRQNTLVVVDGENRYTEFELTISDGTGRIRRQSGLSSSNEISRILFQFNEDLGLGYLGAPNGSFITFDMEAGHGIVNGDNLQILYRPALQQATGVIDEDGTGGAGTSSNQVITRNLGNPSRLGITFPPEPDPVTNQPNNDFRAIRGASRFLSVARFLGGRPGIAIFNAANAVESGQDPNPLFPGAGEDNPDGIPSTVPRFFNEQTRITNLGAATDGQRVGNITGRNSPAVYTTSRSRVINDVVGAVSINSMFQTPTPELRQLSTAEYASVNPAECIVDYLTNRVYGCGESIFARDLDLQSFARHAAFCDDMLPHIDTDGQTVMAERYTCNGVINTNDTRDLNLSDLVTNCQGILGYSLGRFVLATDTALPNGRITDVTSDGGSITIDRVGFGNIALDSAGNRNIPTSGTFIIGTRSDRYTYTGYNSDTGTFLGVVGTPTITEDSVTNQDILTIINGSDSNDNVVLSTPHFNSDNMYGDVTIVNDGFNSIINKLTASFISKDKRYQDDQIFVDIARQNPDLLGNNEPEISQDTRFKFVDNNVMATRLANVIVRKSRETLVVSFTTDSSALANQVGDVVRVTNDSYGFNQKLFRINSISETEVGSDGVTGYFITAQEYNSAVYSEAPITEFAAAPNTNIPNAGDIDPVSDLALVSEQSDATEPFARISFTTPNSLVTEFDIFTGTAISNSNDDGDPTDTSIITNGRLLNQIYTPNNGNVFATNISSGNVDLFNIPFTDTLFVEVRPRNQFGVGPSRVISVGEFQPRELSNTLDDISGVTFNRRNNINPISVENNNIRIRFGDDDTPNEFPNQNIVNIRNRYLPAPHESTQTLTGELNTFNRTGNRDGSGSIDFTGFDSGTNGTYSISANSLNTTLFNTTTLASPITNMSFSNNTTAIGAVAELSTALDNLVRDRANDNSSLITTSTSALTQLGGRGSIQFLDTGSTGNRFQVSFNNAANGDLIEAGNPAFIRIDARGSALERTFRITNLQNSSNGFGSVTFENPNRLQFAGRGTGVTFLTENDRDYPIAASTLTSVTVLDGSALEDSGTARRFASGGNEYTYTTLADDTTFRTTDNNPIMLPARDTFEISTAIPNTSGLIDDTFVNNNIVNTPSNAASSRFAESSRVANAYIIVNSSSTVQQQINALPAGERYILSTDGAIAFRVTGTATNRGQRLILNPVLVRGQDDPRVTGDGLHLLDTSGSRGSVFFRAATAESSMITSATFDGTNTNIVLTNMIGLAGDNAISAENGNFYALVSPPTFPIAAGSTVTVAGDRTTDFIAGETAQIGIINSGINNRVIRTSNIIGTSGDDAITITVAGNATPFLYHLTNDLMGPSDTFTVSEDLDTSITSAQTTALTVRVGAVALGLDGNNRTIDFGEPRGIRLANAITINGNQYLLTERTTSPARSITTTTDIAADDRVAGSPIIFGSVNNRVISGLLNADGTALTTMLTGNVGQNTSLSWTTTLQDDIGLQISFAGGSGATPAITINEGVLGLTYDSAIASSMTIMEPEGNVLTNRFNQTFTVGRFNPALPGSAQSAIDAFRHLVIPAINDVNRWTTTITDDGDITYTSTDDRHSRLSFNNSITNVIDTSVTTQGDATFGATTVNHVGGGRPNRFGIRSAADVATLSTNENDISNYTWFEITPPGENSNLNPQYIIDNTLEPNFRFDNLVNPITDIGYRLLPGIDMVTNTDNDGDGPDHIINNVDEVTIFNDLNVMARTGNRLAGSELIGDFANNRYILARPVVAFNEIPDPAEDGNTIYVNRDVVIDGPINGVTVSFSARTFYRFDGTMWVMLN